jgi:2-keto-3-deoxy-L-rhamnonate aldolase RhmA
MNVAAIQKLRAKLGRKQCAFGMWITLDSASITEMAVFLGLDWIVLDAEHGHLDWGDLAGHLRGAVRSDTVMLIRLAELNTGAIKRALDIGADGVLIPWMETADQLRQAVAAAHYPPAGMRGIGAERATYWGQRMAEHVAESEQNVLVIPMIESVRAGKNIESMLEVPGVDMFFFGPADYSSTAGYAGHWEGPGVGETIMAVKEKIVAKGKYTGVIAANPENLQQRKSQGFQMLAVGLDGMLLMRSIREALTAAGVEQTATKSQKYGE